MNSHSGWAVSNPDMAASRAISSTASACGAAGTPTRRTCRERSKSGSSVQRGVARRPGGSTGRWRKIGHQSGGPIEAIDEGVPVRRPVEPRHRHDRGPQRRVALHVPGEGVALPHELIDSVGPCVLPAKRLPTTCLGQRAGAVQRPKSCSPWWRRRAVLERVGRCAEDRTVTLPVEGIGRSALVAGSPIQPASLREIGFDIRARASSRRGPRLPDGEGEVIAMSIATIPIRSRTHGRLYDALVEAPAHPLPRARAARMGYLGIVVLTTIVLYYLYYVEGAVTPVDAALLPHVVPLLPVPAGGVERHRRLHRLHRRPLRQDRPGQPDDLRHAHRRARPARGGAPHPQPSSDSPSPTA